MAITPARPGLHHCVDRSVTRQEKTGKPCHADGASLTSRGHQVAADVASGRIPRSVLLKPETEQHVPVLHQQVLELLAGSCPARYARPEAGRLAGLASVWTADARRSDDVASKLDVGTSCPTWLVEPDIGPHLVLGSQGSGISLPARWSGPT
jgi:hypothetical protein